MISARNGLSTIINMAIMGVALTILGLGIFNINFLLHPSSRLTVDEILIVSLFLGMLHGITP
ncbi:MAG: hypothetical protein L7H10_04500, partial [Vulcanisaeta sp.]|nr:hypothetical protein [Vulcanisaeta sp.]